METNDIKVLKLIPESPYFNHVKVGVYDKNGDEWRKRCMIDVEYGESDIADIMKRLCESGKTERSDFAGLTGSEKEKATGEIIAYYKGWMHDLIKRLISSDWTAESGEDEVLDIVRDHL